MEIMRDRKNGILYLTQEEYVQKILERFSMDKSKAGVHLLLNISKFLRKIHQKTVGDEERMDEIPYSSAVVLQVINVCYGLHEA